MSHFAVTMAIPLPVALRLEITLKSKLDISFKVDQEEQGGLS